MQKPLVSMLCQKGSVQSLAVDRSGHYMVTSGSEGCVNVWDVRTYKQLYSYRTSRPASSIDISQSGLIAMGFGSHVQTWKDMFTTEQELPYVVHELSGPVVRVSVARLYLVNWLSKDHCSAGCVFLSFPRCAWNLAFKGFFEHRCSRIR